MLRDRSFVGKRSLIGGAKGGRVRKRAFVTREMVQLYCILITTRPDDLTDVFMQIHRASFN